LQALMLLIESPFVGSTPALTAKLINIQYKY
jgi:hypothetical protein